MRTSSESVATRNHITTCDCGCGSPVSDGRKFLNQQHYDRSKELPPEATNQVLARIGSGESAMLLAREYGVCPHNDLQTAKETPIGALHCVIVDGRQSTLAPFGD
jgi:hypothetical protein